MWEKLKSTIQNDQVFYSLLVLIVGCTSFALGRLSAEVPAKSMSPKVEIKSQEIQNVQIMEAGTSRDKGDSVPEGAQVVVASKTGSKYHLPNCPGASQIKPENRITFSTVVAAAAAGYTPAANCPGLR